MKMTVDDLSGSEIRVLPEEHLRYMLEQSPPESAHASEDPNSVFMTKSL